MGHSTCTVLNNSKQVWKILENYKNFQSISQDSDHSSKIFYNIVQNERS